MRKIKLLLSATMALLCGVMAFAQNITVKGIVSDSNGEALPGVAVIVDGSTRGTTTGSDGSYSISAPASATLRFEALGYQQQAIPINGQAVINATLADDSTQLDDVVVVAFGTSTKEAFTGSAKVLNDESLQKAQVTTVTDALAGQVAGVQLMSSNGAPGESASILIRGIGSISAGNTPLIVVDGSPFGGSLSSINPADIESMTVLKDAASNSLYGARGANGVIMITTKKAKAGDAVITVDAKFGVNTKALKDYNTISSPAGYYEQHYQGLLNYFINEKGQTPSEAWTSANSVITGASSNGGLGYDVYTLPEGQYLIGANGKLNPNATLGKIVNYKGEDYLVKPDNWSDYAYRNGIRQEYNVSAAARNQKGSFFASVGYLSNQGITKASDLTRLSARLKADYQAKKWLNVGGNLSISHHDYNELGNNGESNSTGNIWAFTSQLAPIYPLYVRNADGSIKRDANGIKIMDYGSKQNAGLTRTYLGDSNALQDSYLNIINSEGNTASAHGFVDIDIIKGLKLTINGSTYLDETRYKNVYNPFYGQFDSTGGTVEIEHSRYINYNLQQILNYSRQFDKHNVGATLGHEYYNAKSYGLWAAKHNMFSQENTELNGAVSDDKQAGSSISEYNNEGYFFRALYDFDARYFVSASLRRDASSRFAPENRWGNFWSFGAAWILSKESWFKPSFVDELKLKASIGSQGNDNISNYMYTNLYAIRPSSSGAASFFTTQGTKDITWETNTNFNAGFEFGLFGRVSGSLEYFLRKTTDMLYSFSVPSSLGYSSYYANVGDMNNHGIELDLGVNIFRKKNFSWDVNANITWLQNRITMLDDDKKNTIGYDSKGNKYEGYQSGSLFVSEGVSYYTWYLREYAGVDQQTGKPLWYKNVYETDDNGDPVLDDKGNKIWKGREKTDAYAEADYYVSDKCGMAPIFGGFGTTIQAFGFDFSINFSYQLGGWRFDSQYQTFMASPTSSNIGFNYHADIKNAWTAEKPSDDIPRFQFGDQYSAATSTRFLTKASFINIENVNLGYTIPAKLTEKIGISSCRVYVAAENLGYWSMRKGFDPRQGFMAADATSYSPMRTVSGGITVKF